MIDSVFTKIVANKMEDMQTHFVYTGCYYFIGIIAKLRSLIMQRMKKYKMKKVVLTKIYMEQEYLITKEVMEKYCKQEIKSPVKVSVADDLESLFEDICLGNKIHLGHKLDDEVWTYFLPKLTREELELVAKKDSSYMAKFMGQFNDDNDERNPDDIDVDEAEMEDSESDSKFVKGSCRRVTFDIKQPSKLETYCTLQ